MLFLLGTQSLNDQTLSQALPLEIGQKKQILILRAKDTASEKLVEVGITFKQSDVDNHT